MLSKLFAPVSTLYSTMKLFFYCEHYFISGELLVVLSGERCGVASCSWSDTGKDDGLTGQVQPSLCVWVFCGYSGNLNN